MNEWAGARLQGTLEAALARPGRTVAAGGLGLVVLALCSLWLRVDGRVETLLPAEDRGIAGYSAQLRRFGSAETLFVDLGAPDSRTLEAATVAVREALRASPRIAEILGDGEPGGRARAAEVVHRNLPVLLPEEDYPELERRLEPAAIEERLDALLAALLAPGGGARQEEVRRDPLGIGGPVMASIVGGIPVPGAHAAGGGLVSADGRRALLVARAAAPVDDEEAARDLSALFQEAEGSLPPGATLAWTGGPRFHLSNSESLRGDITRVSLIALGLVLAVVAVGFRGNRVVLLAALAVVAGAAGASAAATLAYGEVSALALAFGAALSGITVDYSIHLYAEPGRGERPKEAVRRVFLEAAPSVLVGSATSAAAFLVLLWSGVPALRQLGLASAAGILVSAGFSLAVGPSLMVLFRGDEPADRDPEPILLERASRGWFRFALGRPGTAFLVSAALLAGAAALLPGVRFERDLRRFEAKDPATAADERTVTEHWGGILSMAMVVVHGRDEGAALEKAERVEEALAPFAGGEAGRIVGISGLLPSPARQRGRIAAWRGFWSGERVGELGTRLEEIGGRAGFRGGTFEPFLDSLEGDPLPLSSSSFADTAFSPLLDRHLLAGPDGVRVLVVLAQGRDPGEPGVAWDDAVRSAVPDAEVVTRRGLADAVVGAARRELAHLALPAFLAVGLILLWYYRSPRLALVGLFPLGGALLTTAVVLSVAGEPLNMMNIPVALPIFGLGVDYAVFLMDALQGTPPGAAAAGVVGRRSAPLLGAWFTTLAGGAAMMAATHPAARSLGAALVLGEGASLAFAWLAVPWLAGRRHGASP